MSTLLILWHSRTGASRALAEAAYRSAADQGAARLLPVASAGAEDLLAAGGYLFVGPENLGALSGAMKELLDRCYYPLLSRIEGRVYAHIVAAGSDGEGAARQLARIVTGWRLKPVRPPLIVNLGATFADDILREKSVPAPAIDAAGELGATLSAGLATGIF